MDARILPLLKKRAGGDREHVELADLWERLGRAFIAPSLQCGGFTESLARVEGYECGGNVCSSGFVRTAIAKSAKRGERAGEGLRGKHENGFRGWRGPTRGCGRGEDPGWGGETAKRILIGVDSYFVDAWQRLRPEGWGLLAKQFDDPGRGRCRLA
jgi:hypothetical protein